MPRDRLAELIRQDRALVKDARRLGACLRDLCPASHARSHIHAILTAQSLGIATQLSGSDGTSSVEMLLAKMTVRLHDEAGLREDMARWAVESWAAALGLPYTCEIPKPAPVAKEFNNNRFALFLFLFLLFLFLLFFFFPAHQALINNGFSQIAPTAEPAIGITILLPGDIPMALVRIPAGTFQMGSPDTEQDRDSDEGPVHAVTLTKDFYLGKYAVTKAQWTAVMGTTPWSGKSYVLNDEQSPAIYVSWDMIAGAGGFMQKLNTHLSSTGQGVYQVRLPTEAEWEYACRAGTSTRFYWGDDPDYSQISQYAWWKENANIKGEQYAHVVGLKIPNAWGLYDMSGNVWEWCQDWWGGYPSGAETNPTGASTGSFRGGGWYGSGRYCRSAVRYDSTPSHTDFYVGFRVCASR